MRLDRVDRDLLILFGLIALATFCAASVLSYGTLHWGDVLSVYLQTGILAAAVGVIALILRYTLRARRANASPLQEVRKGLSDKSFWAWLTIPAIIAPIFMASFTIAKSLIGPQVGFTWDAYFADLDATLFGTDPWRLAHTALGETLASYILGMCYVGWGAVALFSMPLAIALASREHAAKFLLSMLLTWTITGLIFAAIFASAGPCFAHLFSPELGERFKPLTERLALILGNDDPIYQTQAYLAAYWNAPVAVKGGGISAFPSVHVGVVALYVIAAWYRLWLRWAAIVFAALIWVGSIYFGYHYAVDGIASSAIAFVCWMIAGRTVACVANRHQQAAALA